LGIPYTETSRRILLEMWRTILSEGAMQLFLVEHRARPLGSRAVSWSTVVFVAKRRLWNWKQRFTLVAIVLDEQVRFFQNSASLNWI